MEEPWTILKVLQWTAGYFSRKGIDQPRANAEVLLAHVLGTERIQLYIHHDKPLSTDELARYREVVRRRATHEPTQYITRKQEFWSLELEITPSVLIPRPETELLVEGAVELLEEGSARILDLGTGSGAIAVAVAHERPSVQVIATDRSLDALGVARRNAARHNVEERIRFLCTDLFGGLARQRAAFDLILSNPPYIGEAEMQSLAPEVVSYEPSLALRGGGPEGLHIIREIIREAPDYMRPGGALLMEIGKGQGEILIEELQGDTRFTEVDIIKDYSGILRVLRLRR